MASAALLCNTLQLAGYKIPVSSLSLLSQFPIAAGSTHRRRIVLIMPFNTTAAEVRAPPRTPPLKNNSLLDHQSLSNPLHMNASSTTLVAHTKEVHDTPLVSEINSLSLTVPVDAWVKGVCCITPETLHHWTSVIKAKKFFGDAKIDEALAQFCSARNELARCVPLSNLLNRVLELMKEHQPELTGLPAVAPIDDMVYFRNDPAHSMVAPKHQGSLAAQRKPNVVAARLAATESRVDGRCLEWYESLFCCELMFGKGINLLEKLNVRRKAENLPERKDDDFPQVRQLHITSVPHILLSCASIRILNLNSLLRYPWSRTPQP